MTTTNKNIPTKAEKDIQRAKIKEQVDRFIAVGGVINLVASYQCTEGYQRPFDAPTNYE